MDLAGELRATIQSYLDSDSPPAALREWLETAAEEIAGSADTDVRRVAAQAWLLISEHDAGDRGEENVRAELRRTLPVEV